MRKLQRNKRVVKKNESVEDPHELLLSLVDLGSIDCEEVLLACVREMSDSECKRVLGSLALPNEEPEEDSLDELPEFPSDEEPEDEECEDGECDEEEPEDDEESIELESRIRKLESAIQRNRFRKTRKF
jgi:hypothetical protein